MSARNLVVVGEQGTNDSLVLVKIPQNLSNEEAKEMLERALRVFVTNKEVTKGNPFVEVTNDKDFLKKFPKRESKIIEICKTILNDVGHPLTVPALTWQYNCQAYLLEHPEFAKKAVCAFNAKRTKEEDDFIREFSLERFVELLKWIIDVENI